MKLLKLLAAENVKLLEKVDQLYGKCVSLGMKLEANLQYERLAKMVITGIPALINLDELESIVIKLFNSLCHYKNTIRDIIAYHRISNKSNFVLVKFVNI